MRFRQRTVRVPLKATTRGRAALLLAPSPSKQRRAKQRAEVAGRAGEGYGREGVRGTLRRSARAAGSCRHSAAKSALRFLSCPPVNGKMEMDVEGVSPRLSPSPAPGAGGACQRRLQPPQPQPQPPPLPPQHPAPDEPLERVPAAQRTATIPRRRPAAIWAERARVPQGAGHLVNKTKTLWLSL